MKSGTCGRLLTYLFSIFSFNIDYFYENRKKHLFSDKYILIKTLLDFSLYSKVGQNS